MDHIDLYYQHRADPDTPIEDTGAPWRSWFRSARCAISGCPRLRRRPYAAPAQFALAWVLAQGGDITPIPGTKHIKYLEDNLGALDVRLTNEDKKRLDQAFPFGAASGDRYPEQGMRAVNL